MLLYGRNVIREIIDNNKRKVKNIFMLKDIKDADDIVRDAKARGISIVYRSRQELKDLTKTDNNQGMAIEVEDLKFLTIEEFLKKHENKGQITVAVLDSVEDPHNVGAIIRSCEIFGVCGIITASKRAAPVNETVYKVSSGAADYVDIVVETNINRVLEKLKEAGFWTYGFDLQAEKFLDETEFDKKTAVVFGSEGEGMRRLVKENCDFLVKIRQTGKLDSLNVSNAAAVAFYEINRQRKDKK